MDIAMLRDMFSGDMQKNGVFFDEPMKRHTTLRIGGSADMFTEPGDIISLKGLLTILRDGDIPIMPLGGGSNLLVSDSGIEGVVLSLAAFDRIEVLRDKGDDARLFVGAGVPLQKLVNFCKEKGFSGIEGLAGIPGSVGGAVRGNAGSFGYETGRVLESVALLRRDSSISILDSSRLNFGYRSSSLGDEDIILSVNIILKRGDAGDVSRTTTGYLQEKVKKQPLSGHSAGCVFKNPAGGYAGRLIDEAGCKGMRRGDIEVSSIHANFFMNTGNGTASDFVAMMDDVKEKVIRMSGIELDPEIRITGRSLC